MLRPVFFIPATKSFRLLPFLFLSVKMSLLVTTRAVARGNFYMGAGEMSNFLAATKGEVERDGI